jgi:hypothetical protein
VLSAPTLYYPRTNGFGNEPWILTNPSLVAERQFGPSWRAHVGLGLIAAGCVDGLFGSHDHDEGMGFMGGVWNTLPAGVAYRMAQGWDLFADAQMILSGFRPAGADWIGGPPFTLAIGATAHL